MSFFFFCKILVADLGGLMKASFAQKIQNCLQSGRTLGSAPLKSVFFLLTGCLVMSSLVYPPDQSNRRTIDSTLKYPAHGSGVRDFIVQSRLTPDPGVLSVCSARARARARRWCACCAMHQRGYLLVRHQKNRVLLEAATESPTQAAVGLVPEKAT